MESIKVQMNLRKPTIDRIESLKESMGTDNHASVIASCIQIAHQLVKHSRNGAVLMIEHEDGSRKELTLVGLED